MSQARSLAAKRLIREAGCRRSCVGSSPSETWVGSERRSTVGSRGGGPTPRAITRSRSSIGPASPPSNRSCKAGSRRCRPPSSPSMSRRAAPLPTSTPTAARSTRRSSGCTASGRTTARSSVSATIPPSLLRSRRRMRSSGAVIAMSSSPARCRRASGSALRHLPTSRPSTRRHPGRRRTGAHRPARGHRHWRPRVVPCDPSCPTLRLPTWCVDSPWWLVFIAHEVGHNIQQELGLVQPFRTVVAGAWQPAEPEATARGERWGRWSPELFADLVSVALIGPWAIEGLRELVLGPPAEMARSRAAIPHRSCASR